MNGLLSPYSNALGAGMHDLEYQNAPAQMKMQQMQYAQQQACLQPPMSKQPDKQNPVLLLLEPPTE